MARYLRRMAKPIQRVIRGQLMLIIIWAILVVPAFSLFAYWSFRWAEEDLEAITNNDKLGLYAICGLLALGWPLVAAFTIGNIVNRYINGEL
jgi:TRAP-type C4-dicarboxylate transport system permease small subunit